MSDELVAAFRRQNPKAAAGLTDEEIEPFAEHHSGGLVVMGSPAGEPTGVDLREYYAKMHDSWGPDDAIVVHCYDVDQIDESDPRSDQVTYHEDSRSAFRHFLSWLRGPEPKDEPPQQQRTAILGTCGTQDHVGIHRFQNDPDPCIDWTDSLVKVVTVVHTFRVHPDLPDADIDNIVNTMTIQVQEPVVGYSDDMSLNEITCDTSHVTVHWSAQDITKEV